MYGWYSTTEILLQPRADANARNMEVRTTLHLAVMSSSPGIARLLLEGGADVDMKDDTGTILLHEAGGI